TGLLDYQSYGCGVVLGTPLPPNFCGGKVKLRVTLTTPAGQLPATMTVICIIGPNPPDSALGDKRSEGAMLVVPGVINFNPTAAGDNVISQTGWPPAFAVGFVRYGEPAGGQPAPGTSRRLPCADVPPALAGGTSAVLIPPRPAVSAAGTPADP